MRELPDDLAETADARAMRTALLVLAPALVSAAPLELLGEFGPWGWVAAPVAAVVLVLVAVSTLGHLARFVASLIFVAWAAGSVVENAGEPSRGFLVALGLVAFLAFLWPSERLARRRRVQPGDGVFLASVIALAFGLDAWKLQTLEHWWVALPFGVADLMLVWLAHRAVLLPRPRDHVFAALAALAAGLPLVAALGSAQGEAWGATIAPLGFLAPLGLAWRFGVRLLDLQGESASVGPAAPTLLDVVLAHPSRVLVLSFLALGAAGTVLLAVPASASGGHPIAWLDAAFTAVSASCVTGLAVLDTPTDFSEFGQVGILVLIQVGGLGIMAFSTAALVLLGRRLSISHERAAVDLVGAQDRASLARAIRVVLAVTLVTELLGALLLFPAFWRDGDPLLMAAWRALFTSISAFCSAGFALQSDSLVGYADDPFVLLVLSGVILFGGLGPVVVTAILSWRERTRRTLHVRLVLWATLVLFLVPAVLIGAFEWERSLDGLSIGDKIINAIFQSVTLRTAGFNSVDLLQIHPATWSVMIVTMFVGGSPGSTAGGVKTTTIAVVLLGLLAVIRGRTRVEVFGRTLPMVVLLRASAVAALGVFGIVVALVALQLTQALPLDVALFEVTSALATVGLSIGGTGELDEAGKVVIIACMFTGRVGPLTLFMFFATQPREGRLRYPTEAVPIG